MVDFCSRFSFLKTRSFYCRHIFRMMRIALDISISLDIKFPMYAHEARLKSSWPHKEHDTFFSFLT